MSIRHLKNVYIKAFWLGSNLPTTLTAYQFLPTKFPSYQVAEFPQGSILAPLSIPCIQLTFLTIPTPLWPNSSIYSYADDSFI